MSDKKSNPPVSIQQLYAKRKAQHTMPEHLKESLLKQAKKKHHSKRIFIAIPAAMASLFVVAIIWPNRNMLETQSFQYPETALKEKAAIQPMESPVLEMDTYIETSDMAFDELQADDIQAEEAAEGYAFSASPTDRSVNSGLNIATANESRVKKEITEQAAQKQIITLSAPEPKPKLKPSATTLSMEAKVVPEAVSILEADEQYDIQEESEALFLVETLETDRLSQEIIIAEAEETHLQVINGAEGLFKNCKGEEVTLPLKTTLQGWVNAVESNDGAWTLTELEEKQPCKQD